MTLREANPRAPRRPLSPFFEMAAAGATTPSDPLKRTAQELDVEVAPGTEKVQLAGPVVKRSKIKDSKHLFTSDPLDLILTLRVEHEPLSRDELVAGYILTHARYSHQHFQMYSVEALAHTSRHPSVIQWRQEAIEALDSDNESVASAVVLEANTRLAKRLGKKVVSARPHTCIFRSRSNCDAEHFDLGHDDPFPWKDVSSFWGQPFFQGAKLVLKPLGATGGDEVVSVPLDEHGICTLGTFVDTVCDLKVGTPYNDKITFTIASTWGLKVLQGANDGDADGAVAAYEWEW